MTLFYLIKRAPSINGLELQSQKLGFLPRWQLGLGSFPNGLLEKVFIIYAKEGDVSYESCG